MLGESTNRNNSGLNHGKSYCLKIKNGERLKKVKYRLDLRIIKTKVSMQQCHII